MSSEKASSRIYLAVLTHRLAHTFRQRHGLPAVPALEAHDALHLLLGQPPTPQGERVVLTVQGLAAHLAASAPEGHPLRALRWLVGGDGLPAGHPLGALRLLVGGDE